MKSLSFLKSVFSKTGTSPSRFRGFSAFFAAAPFRGPRLPENKKRALFFCALLLAAAAGAFLFLFRNQIFLSEDARFQKFTDRLFLEEISGNTLNLHYTLAYPENYGLSDYEISLGSLDPQAIEESQDSLLKLQKKLEEFTPSQLSPENQLVYDLLRLEFATELSLGEHYLLQEPLGPNLGIQAQLPVLLAEYPFRTSQDIQDYFSILSILPQYFQEILEFEQEKSKKGLFMSDASADRILEQCRSFTEAPEENYLYSMFEQQIGELLRAGQISQKQADSFTKLHDKLMKKYVFPAYSALADGLEALKGTGKNENGLSHLPGGKAYYEYLIKSDVGDYRPADEIWEELCRQLIQDSGRLGQLLEKDSELPEKAAAVPLDSSFSPEEMLEYLSHVMTDDFPAFDTADYEVKYVPEAMEDFSSPAFYLTPPVDTLSPNSIYINQSSQVSCAELFTTLAHEGFPGHLYQTLYFSSQDAPLIRNLFSFSGYVEGWATYVENLSYAYGASFLGIQPEVMDYLRLNRSVSLCLYSILDMGIHHKGWTLETVTEVLSSFGVLSQETCREIFQYIVENPANYLKYYLGSLNFSSLKETVQELEGDSFDIKEFHENLLDIGPAQFPVIKKYLLRRY